MLHSSLCLSNHQDAKLSLCFLLKSPLEGRQKMPHSLVEGCENPCTARYKNCLSQSNPWSFFTLNATRSHSHLHPVSHGLLWKPCIMDSYLFKTQCPLIQGFRLTILLTIVRAYVSSTEPAGFYLTRRTADSFYQKWVNFYTSPPF